VYARINNWPGPNPGRFVEQWKDTELSKKEISMRLFDELYPSRPGSAAAVTSSTTPEDSGQQSSGSETGGPKTENSNQPAITLKPQELKNSVPAKAGPSKPETSTFSEASKRNLGVLFTASSEECARFRAARDENLRDEVLTSRDGKLRQAAERCDEVLNCLKVLVEKACPKSR